MRFNAISIINPALATIGGPGFYPFQMSPREFSFWFNRVKKLNVSGFYSSQPSINFDIDVGKAVSAIPLVKEVETWKDCALYENTGGEFGTQFTMQSQHVNYTNVMEVESWYPAINFDIFVFSASMDTVGTLVATINLNGVDLVTGSTYSHSGTCNTALPGPIPPGTINIVPIEFWPYEDDDGNLLYNSSTGAKI